MKLPIYFFAILICISCQSKKEETATTEEIPQKPNIVVVFTDDQGYRDVGVYGAPDFETPHLDQMAAEGIRFTDFYVSQGVCSASRSSLLTGCYANRVSIHGALMPPAQVGLHPDETTLAEICKSQGYATAMYGKWHLGHRPGLFPTDQGFDQYYGLPYSNDMWPKHPNNENFDFPRLPVYQNDSIVGYLDEDQNRLTTEYAERAVQFIEENKDQPFFLYMAHSMPHVPLYVSDKFRGKSENGLYGDVIMEIDWSVGQILETLEKHGLDENTLVIFTSDNGPWLSYGTHSGSALPLREGKGTALEGGVRVPCIMRWPGHIPAGAVQEKPAMTIDILPTVAKLIDADLPEKKIDGKNIWPLMANEPGAENPHEAYYFYYKRNELHGMRMGKWKLYFPHEYRSIEGREGRSDGMPIPYNNHMKMGLELYDLENDISETSNVAEQHPEVVAKMQKVADQMREKLGDSLKDIEGSEVREPGRVEEVES